MLSTFFRKQNYEVVTADWGADALRICENQPVDLVILDIRLPDIDGYEICRQLRTSRQTRDIPVIFLTEKSDRMDRLQGLELGVVDYITKPFDITELLLRVRNAITRAAQHNVTSPVTELPEGTLVQEQIQNLLKREDEWALLVLSISRFGEFRELYGFVAADDVLRAIALMIRNAARELGSEDDFIGHLAAEDFVVITSPGAVNSIQERLEARMEQSREYFYPLRDRLETSEDVSMDHLRLSSAWIDSTAGPFDSLEGIFDALGYVPRA
jgi:PleD family two-component response regulator